MDKYLLIIQQKIQELIDLNDDFNNTIKYYNDVIALQETNKSEKDSIEQKLNENKMEYDKKSDAKAYFREKKVITTTMFISLFNLSVILGPRLFNFKLSLIEYAFASFSYLVAGSMTYFFKTSAMRKELKSINVEEVQKEIKKLEKELKDKENLFDLIVDQISIINSQSEAIKSKIDEKELEIGVATESRNKAIQRLIGDLLEQQTSDEPISTNNGYPYVIRKPEK